MLIGGQSPYWGKTPIESLENWYYMGADFLMLKPNKCDWYDAQNMEIYKDKLEALVNRANELEMGILIHPGDFFDGMDMLTPSNPNRREQTKTAFKNIAKQIERYSLMKYLPVHPPLIKHKKHTINQQVQLQSEEVAWETTKDFYRELEIPFISVENVPAPGIGGYLMLGYTEEQLNRLCDKILLDTGHMLLSDINPNNLDVDVIHLHTNDGTDDQHKLMPIDQIKKLGLVELIQQKPTVLEIKKYDYTKEQIKEYITELRKLA